MIEIERVLFPTDFSDTADEALAQAAEAARFFSAELSVLHVVQSWPADSLPRDDEKSFEALVRALEKEAHDRITALGEVPAVTVERAVRRGDDVAPTILAFAEEVGADMIVMATHGRRGLRKWLVGSVTQEVLREADRPVLTLRRREQGLNFDQAQSLLVPVDFSEPSLQSLVYARELAALAGASIDLLHVTERPIYPNFYGDPGAGAGMAAAAYDLTRLRERSERELTKLVEEGSGPEVPYTVRAVEGRPAEQIVEHARKRSNDLVVMASRGLSGVSRLLIGSVAEEVVRCANRPVLTVRQPSGRAKP